jgi:hypothetical protein
VYSANDSVKLVLQIDQIETMVFPVQAFRSKAVNLAPILSNLDLAKSK